MSNQEKILVVGCDAAVQRVLERIEQCAPFQFQFAPCSGHPAILLQGRPAAILLIIPEDSPRKRQALDWLKALKEKAPVVVLSVAADMDVFVACMTCGAYDYVTGFTPMDEILRILENAVHAADPVAA